jgi:hypothetical protein
MSLKRKSAEILDFDITSVLGLQTATVVGILPLLF